MKNPTFNEVLEELVSNCFCKRLEGEWFRSDLPSFLRFDVHERFPLLSGEQKACLAYCIEEICELQLEAYSGKATDAEKVYLLKEVEMYRFMARAVHELKCVDPAKSNFEIA